MPRGSVATAAVRVAPGRLRHTTSWVKALCGISPTGLTSRITLTPGAWARGLTMIADASPWGGGGFLSLRGHPVAWLATSWTEDDARATGCRLGDHRDQALYELLIVVVCAKAWRTQWRAKPTMLRIKSDSMAALGALSKGGSA